MTADDVVHCSFFYLFTVTNIDGLDYETSTTPLSSSIQYNRY